MGDDWNSFMQSRPVKIAMYGICAAFGVFYAIGAARELLHPEAQAQYVETIGLPGFYAITGIRLVVMLWVGIMFARMVWKVIKEDK